MKERKKHYFDDCPGFHYSAKQDVIMVKNITEITCGQCKGRILNNIAAKNWEHLNYSEKLVLEDAANLVKSK